MDDLRVKFSTLSEEEQQKFVSKLRDTLSSLPENMYNTQVSNLTTQFGTDFVSKLLTPTSTQEEVTVPEVNLSQAEPSKESVPWYAKPLQLASKIPGVEPALEGINWLQSVTSEPAAIGAVSGIQKLIPGEQGMERSLREAGEMNPWALTREAREKIWEQQDLPWGVRGGLEIALDPLTWFPGWGFGEKALKSAERRGLTGLAKALKPVAEAENAYMKAASVPFEVAGKGLKKIPEIPLGKWQGIQMSKGLLPYPKGLTPSKERKLGALFQESPKSMVANETRHVWDAVSGLERAGEVTGKSLRTILDDIRFGRIDQRLLDTVTNPQQKASLQRLVANKDKLDLEMLSRVADKYSDRVKLILGEKQMGILASEHGVKLMAKRPGVVGFMDSVYNLWRQSVLYTPWYVQQNLIENPFRLTLSGVNPFDDWKSAFVGKTDDEIRMALANEPIDIQRRFISLRDRLNQVIPETLPQGGLAKTATTGGLSEAVAGSLATGKKKLPLTIAAWADDMSILRMYFNTKKQFAEELMQTGTVRAQDALEQINKLFDDASLQTRGAVTTATESGAGLSLGGEYESLVKQAEAIAPTNPSVIEARKFVDMLPKEQIKALRGLENLEDELKAIAGKSSAAGMIEQDLLDSLRNTCLTGTPEEIEAAFNGAIKNGFSGASKPITEAEKALPQAITSRLDEEIPSLFSKGDLDGIKRLFREMEVSLPQRLEAHQKQVMLQHLSTYRRLVRNTVPERVRPMLTKVINSFKVARVSEAEKRITSSKSFTEFQQALFKSSVESRRELERISEGVMLSEAIAGRVDENVLAGWYALSNEINEKAFVSSEKFLDDTWSLSRTLTGIKAHKPISSSSAAKKAWDEYILKFQSEFPEKASVLQNTAPDLDTLWSTYRSVQEERWFRVGQEKLRGMGLNIGQLPSVVDNSGNLITPEMFMQEQKQALDSWYKRVEGQFMKRNVAPTTRTELLDKIKTESIRVRQRMGLEDIKLQNAARDMALNATYGTFGSYGVRTTMDDIMCRLGAPFWFFPSRSVPFYAKQMLTKPRIGAEVATLQQQAEESQKPIRLFGYAQVPGTDLFWNPQRSTMLWQLMGEYDWTPSYLGGLENAQRTLAQKVGVSFGPQWQIAANIAQRITGKQIITGEPQQIIPQHRWIEAVQGLDLPGLSQLAGVTSEPFDMYLRAIYGDEIANWQQREVEKYLVDSGYDPADLPNLPANVIQDAWKRYHVRQLLGMPFGTVKEWTPTDRARYEALAEKAKELGLTEEQRKQFRRSGESPFTGLRQDQLEAIFSDLPGEGIWENIRPTGLTHISEPYWDDYVRLRKERTLLRGDPDNLDSTPGSRISNQLKYDAALRDGKITPADWKELRSSNYDNYSSKIEQAENDYPYAMTGEEQWEEFRNMLGWDKPVRHPDDVILDLYYDTMDSMLFEDELGQFNFDLYNQFTELFNQGIAYDGQNFVKFHDGPLDTSTISYIESRKDKYKTPLELAYKQDMAELSDYWHLRDQILNQVDPQTASLIEQAYNAPTYAVQQTLLRSNPSAIMALRLIRRLQTAYKQANPKVDQLLAYWSS